VKRATNGALVNVVLDMVGGPYMQKNLRCLAMDGRLVFIAFLGGEVAENLDLRPIMLKRLVVTGSTMRPRSTAQKGAIATALLEKVWPLLDAGAFAPVIHAVMPLQEAAAAHTLMESSAHIGKIMLTVA
jgi:NADPH2:quinone reductase